MRNVTVIIQFGGGHLYHKGGLELTKDIIRNIGRIGNPTFDNTGRVMLWKHSNTKITASFSIGVALTMQWFRSNYINLNIFVSTEHKKKIKGIYGTYDGDTSNDLMNREGVSLNINTHRHWKIDDHMSSCKCIF